MLRAISLQLAADELSATTVVFDATSRHNSAGETDEQYSTGGLTVRFAANHAEADDLLEELIRSHPHPKTLTVVSSDHRIQRCARAKRAKVLSADQFLDLLDSPQQENPRSSSASEEVDISLNDIDISDEDVDYWLREFGSQTTRRNSNEQ
jgi:hypothetical protein